MEKLGLPRVTDADAKKQEARLRAELRSRSDIAGPVRWDEFSDKPETFALFFSIGMVALYTSTVEERLFMAASIFQSIETGFLVNRGASDNTGARDNKTYMTKKRAIDFVTKHRGDSSGVGEISRLYLQMRTDFSNVVKSRDRVVHAAFRLEVGEGLVLYNARSEKPSRSESGRIRFDQLFEELPRLCAHLMDLWALADHLLYLQGSDPDFAKLLAPRVREKLNQKEETPDNEDH